MKDDKVDMLFNALLQGQVMEETDIVHDVSDPQKRQEALELNTLNRTYGRMLGSNHTPAQRSAIMSDFRRYLQILAARQQAQLAQSRKIKSKKSRKN